MNTQTIKYLLNNSSMNDTNHLQMIWLEKILKSYVFNLNICFIRKIRDFIYKTTENMLLWM